MKRSPIGRVRIECQRCGGWAEAQLMRVRSAGFDHGLVTAVRGCRCPKWGAAIHTVAVTPIMPKPGRTREWDGGLCFRMPHAPRRAS